MKNTYYVIFMLCLATAQTKPMITCGSAESREEYYKLNNMPEDILKEIVFGQREILDPNDVKTARYHEKCLKLHVPCKLTEYGLEAMQPIKDILNSITSLSCTDRTLHDTLAPLITILNSIILKKDANLKLNYFIPFKKELCTYTRTHFVDENRRCCEFYASIQYNEPNQLMSLRLVGQLKYFLHESEKLLFLKAIKSYEEKPSLQNAQKLLAIFSDEGLNEKDNNNIKQCIGILYFLSNNIDLKATVDKLLSDGKKINMSARFDLFASEQK